MVADFTQPGFCSQIHKGRSCDVHSAHEDTEAYRDQVIFWQKRVCALLHRLHGAPWRPLAAAHVSQRSLPRQGALCSSPRELRGSLHQPRPPSIPLFQPIRFHTSCALTPSSHPATPKPISLTVSLHRNDKRQRIITIITVVITHVIVNVVIFPFHSFLLWELMVGGAGSASYPLYPVLMAPP